MGHQSASGPPWPQARLSCAPPPCFWLAFFDAAHLPLSTLAGLCAIRTDRAVGTKYACRHEAVTKPSRSRHGAAEIRRHEHKQPLTHARTHARHVRTHIRLLTRTHSPAQTSTRAYTRAHSRIAPLIVIMSAWTPAPNQARPTWLVSQPGRHLPCGGALVA